MSPLTVEVTITREQVIDALFARLALPAATTKTTTPPRIGETWPEEGGIYAGVMRGEDGGSDYHLIVPTQEEAYAKAIEWGAQGVDEPGAKHMRDGYANTTALVDSESDHPAAEWAAALEIDGHSDFYLPSRAELRLIWVNVPELFEDGWYWSSTQSSPNGAWGQTFPGGNQYGAYKDGGGRARAVRRLSVI